MSQNNILIAARFAAQAHQGQVRKYTGVPYISHPSRIAGRMASHDEATETRVMAAFLHDTIEDTWVTYDDIAVPFGECVADMVGELTDPTSPGLGDAFKGVPRAQRKAAMRAAIAGASRGARILKLLDRIDNLREMPLTPPNKYIRMYLEESRLLAEAIGDCDSQLKSELLELCSLT